MQHEFFLIFNSRKNLILSLFLVWIFILSGCQKQSVTSSEIEEETFQINELPIKGIPKDWQKIETEYFSFSIPPTMKNKNVRGKDTFIWQYEDEKITLAIESGSLLGDLSKSTDFSAQRYESKIEKTTINNEEAIVLKLDFNKPKLENWATDAKGLTGFEKVEKNNLLSVRFPNQQTIFSTGSSTNEATEIAKLIFYSIKFKQK